MSVFPPWARSNLLSVLAAVLVLPLCPAATAQTPAASAAPYSQATHLTQPTQNGRPDRAESSGLPDAPSTVQSPGQTEDSDAERRRLEHEEGAREVKTEETQRILAVVPNFNTVISGRGVALSKEQKTELAVHATLDPFNLVGAFVLAGASELSDSDRGYGWGPGGYAKRVGARLADVADGTMLAGAVYPILLHQDPRFFRQGTGTIRSRVRHALIAPFVCRGDNQKPQPNYSNLLGNFTAGAISNAYYPASDRGVSLTLVNSSIVTLEGSLGNIGLEFAPDVSAWWHRRRAAKQAPQSGAIEPDRSNPAGIQPTQ